MNKRILLVEDELNLQHALKLNMEMEGFHVEIAKTGPEAVKLFKEQKFHLVVLDVMLPDMDGFMVCENIRLFDKTTPILFLTAKNQGQDRINGLKKGGDDYLTKPFELEELMLRINKLIEKSNNIKQVMQNMVPKVYHFGNCWINFESLEAKGVNGTFHLTKKEAQLIKLLIENKNQVVSREHILKVVWDYVVIPNTRTIDNFILSLRKYFEEDPKLPVYIQSVRGIGYRFVEHNSNTNPVDKVA